MLYITDKFKISLLVFIPILISSCFQKNDGVNPLVKAQLRKADSEFVNGNRDSSMKILVSVRSKILDSDPTISTYYCFRTSIIIDPDQKNLYADSALAFFSTDKRIHDYPNEYLKALLTKGDACVQIKKYIAALNYYNKAQKVLTVISCDNGELSSKMGDIYYSQRNFRLAARYWSESYRQLQQCHDKINPADLFLKRQSSLNNTGFAFFRAGVLDSANYYYLKDVQVINTAESLHIANPHNINAARIAVYDNLGGVNLKQGNLAVAERYLTQCIAIPLANSDGTKITPLLKLCDLYMRTGNMQRLPALFSQSKAQLDVYYKDNPNSLVQWNLLYAQYLFKVHQAAKAYTYQYNYIRLKDSVNNSSSQIYRLDVEGELAAINQKQQVTELEQKNNAKKVYLMGIGLIVFLSIIIIILINGNLNKSKKNHRDATLHNQQLQQTLQELEHVNKNYIRIMRVMAHDLINPLSGMTGIASMLMVEGVYSEDNQHMLRLIETTGMHSMEMINELLKSGLADENEQLQTDRIDLRSLLFDSVELLQFKASEKEQNLIFESSGEPMFAQVNHEKIWRVFNNLIVNAIKFSHAGGEIHIGIKLSEKQILISVADSGVGIPDKDKDKVFEMFTSAKKVGTGGEQPFGLGLSISKKIIDMHHGKIWFESTPGVGTTFYIQLPGVA